MNIETLKTIIITLIGSSAVWGFMQFLIERKDKNNEKLKELLEAVKKLSEKVDKIANDQAEAEAIACRVRILTFMDELLNNQRHTKDRYDQVNSDITKYEQHCRNYPNFKNNQTASTIEYINKNYQERLDKHDFL